MMVMNSATAISRCDRAMYQPAKMNQMTFRTTPNGPVPTSCAPSSSRQTTSRPKGQKE